MKRLSPSLRGNGSMPAIFKKIVLSGALLLLVAIAFPQNIRQDAEVQSFLLSRIRQLQADREGTILPGLFYSYISNKEKFSDSKTDENIFYTGLIAYTLKEMAPFLDVNKQQQIDTILQNAFPVFEKFKNKHGRATYNFWRTDTAFTFPYTWWIKILRGPVTLPDDMDDTSLGLLALDAPDSVARNVHQLMASYTHDGIHTLRSPLKYFPAYNAYSVWFGKKFPVVFDVCVLTNVLAFTQTYNLPWNAADSASLQLIIRVIKEKDYLQEPLEVSPYYGKPSIFLYNLSRLMAIKKIPELEAIKTTLVEQAAIELAQTTNLMERIILSTAILKWGYMPPKIVLPGPENIQDEIEQNDFAFFIGNIPSYLSDGLRKFLLAKNAGLFYHYCPAYNDALLLEYLVLRNQE